MSDQNPVQDAVSKRLSAQEQALPMRFRGQFALVSGGASGIGFGIARRLGREGARVALLDHNAEALDNAVALLSAEGLTVEPACVDVTDPQDVREVIDGFAALYGNVQVLIACAGITGQTQLRTHEVPLDDLRRVFAVNLEGVVHCIQAVLPHMLHAHYGRIVNIASISGKEGNVGMLAESTSKAAVIGLTKVVGKEYATEGITCNAIALGVVSTTMVDAMPDEQVQDLTNRIPMQRPGKIEEIAALVAYVASAEASFSTGFTFDASGGRATY